MKERLKPALTHQNWLDDSETVKMNIKVRPYNMKELCRMYELSYKALKANIKPFIHLLGEKKGYFFNVKQVEIIFMQLGIPYSIHEV
jgi:hypothetical protein